MNPRDWGYGSGSGGANTTEQAEARKTRCERAAAKRRRRLVIAKLVEARRRGR